MSEDKIESRFIGALLGTFVGDALGMPYEVFGAATTPIEMLHGIYTDDTQMMIGIAESLVACGGFDGADMAARFVENFDPVRGYGRGAFYVVERLLTGYSWDQAGEGLFEGGSYGNGSAMRIAPIGIFYHDDTEKLCEIAVQSSIITHTHPLGKQAAMLQAYAVGLALQYGISGELDTDEFVQKLWDILPEDAETYHEKLACIRGFLAKEPAKSEVIGRLGNDIRAFESVPTAIFSFLKNYESYEDAVTYAISLGGDTDTIGAMTGAIAGAYHGCQGIPFRWLEKLENGAKGRDYVIRLAKKLYQV